MRRLPVAVLVLWGSIAPSSLLVSAGPSLAAGALPQPVAFDDGSSGGHRHGRRTQDTKSKPADTPAKPIVPETEAQHRAYIQQYGFGMH